MCINALAIAVIIINTIIMGFPLVRQRRSGLALPQINNISERSNAENNA